MTCIVIYIMHLLAAIGLEKGTTRPYRPTPCYNIAIPHLHKTHHLFSCYDFALLGSIYHTLAI